MYFSTENQWKIMSEFSWSGSSSCRLKATQETEEIICSRASMSQGPNTSSEHKFPRFSPHWSILSRQWINPTLIAQKATFCWCREEERKAIERIRLKVPTFPHATTPDLARLPKKPEEKFLPPRSVLLFAPWKLNKLSRRSMNVWMRISSSNHLEYYLFGIEFPFSSRNWNFSDLFSKSTHSFHRRVHIFVWISIFFCAEQTEQAGKVSTHFCMQISLHNVLCILWRSLFTNSCNSWSLTQCGKLCLNFPKYFNSNQSWIGLLGTLRKQQKSFKMCFRAKRIMV